VLLLVLLLLLLLVLFVAFEKMWQGNCFHVAKCLSMLLVAACGMRIAAFELLQLNAMKMCFHFHK